MTKDEAEKLLSARYDLNRASDQCVVGYWMVSEGLSGDFHRRQAIEALTKAATVFGFDLVKRQTPAEMHDAALAKGHAEDAIEDNLWSR